MKSGVLPFYAGCRNGSHQLVFCRFFHLLAIDGSGDVSVHGKALTQQQGTVQVRSKPVLVKSKKVLEVLKVFRLQSLPCEI